MEADFGVFCSAVQAWLRRSPSLDPALAAAADVLEAGSLAERDLVSRARDCSDAHAQLGARATLDLWQAVRYGRYMSAGPR